MLVSFSVLCTDMTRATVGSFCGKRLSDVFDVDTVGVVDALSTHVSDDDEDVEDDVEDTDKASSSSSSLPTLTASCCSS